MDYQPDSQSCSDSFINISRLDTQTPLAVNLEMRYSCVHTLISEQAQCSPQFPAICSSSEEITHGHLEAVSNQLSQRLSSAGVVAGTFVAFCFEKSIVAVVAMLAILKAGGACVALDPKHPRRRFQSIFKATSAKFILTSPVHAGLFEDDTAMSIIVLRPDILQHFSTDDASLKCTTTISPDSPAFVVFTSGSSGEPKGVILQHAAICTSAQHHGPAMHVNSNTRAFQYAPYTFDMSIYDIFTTLIHGGCVCIPSDEDRFNNITGAMRDMKANWAFLPPSLVSLLDPEDVPGLETLQLGAEPASVAVIRTWGDKVRLINGYGSTECSTAIIGTLTSTDDPSFIGFPFGAGAWIVNPLDHDVLLSIGSVGELVIAGPVLSQGYLNDQVSTQNKFLERTSWLPDEYAQKGLRIFKTGDLAQQSDDGSFKLVGRKGNMVKVRGQRVELGEIEKQLSLNHDVKLCIADFPKEGLHRDCLTAVYQPRLSAVLSTGRSNDEMEIVGRRELEAAGIRSKDFERFLTEYLPNYMVPQRWVAVRTLPLLSSGKRDRCKINSWLASLHHSQLSINPSKSDFDSVLPGKPNGSSIWQEIISLLRELTNGAFPLCDADNETTLTEAGFDSIRQIALNRKIKEKFNLPIELSILSNMSPLRISKFITARQAGQGLPTQLQIANPLEEYGRLRLELQRTLPPSSRKVRRIFLTGASGFLGIYILRELLLAAPDTVIICLTRAHSTESGLQRLSNSARTANWSLGPFHNRVRVWTGDLSLPNLGLTALQWDCLTGKAPSHELIDAVIHNGADVHWTKDYSTLSAPNVHSTLSIIQAIAQSQIRPSLTYVSGGKAWKATEGSDFELLQDADSLCGYDLSKLLSELLVREFSKLSNNHSVSIIRPGYIIGTAEDGIANTDDFIWRLVAANIDLKVYNGDEADAWLYISGVDRVAEAVVREVLQPTPGMCKIRNVTDGLTMQEFWDLFKDEMKCEMRPVRGSTWLEKVQAAAEKTGDTHPLWPLLDVLISIDGRAGVERAEKTTSTVVSKNVRATILKNIGFLRQTQFLPTVLGHTHSGTNIKAFGRHTSYNT